MILLLSDLCGDDGERHQHGHAKELGSSGFGLRLRLGQGDRGHPEVERHSCVEQTEADGLSCPHPLDDEEDGGGGEDGVAPLRVLMEPGERRPRAPRQKSQGGEIEEGHRTLHAGKNIALGWTFAVHSP